ncbi:trypsin-like peptidase domain-containing protein [Pseudomonas sp. 21LCFQ02]|nr:MULTISPECIES: Do family serine endopeptidase AlgW [unclassified Pseudomonas]MCO8164056.1 trypsin-like peptidase domain-containing protein [Pseudomonas sp. 21LCFQ010]MCO8166633.1 trypsin-like peptidase domain-containing protein [Pseudomonas sp. 21LCFQ02]BAP43530.1 peptidase S1, chymotrypsin:PDZ/DHR/GLGF [Pseudomonas sp. StFLB209]
MLKALRYFGWPLLAGVLVALLVIQRFPQWVGLPSLDVNLQQAPQSTQIVQGPSSYADAVSAAAPAVVNLYSTRLINKSANPLFEDPQFRRFFGDNQPKQKRMESSLGSGVLMSPEGYILTNNHVTSGADQIIVALKDGRETVARVIGNDPETDLAVVKIDLKNLQAITIARSDNIRIGDVALAIGNPFGVGQTVTMGIISATGRNQLGLNTYEDFIQTDAAINPGNSGGALVDANGNLIGINTAIFTESRGSQGIGFSIPTKLAIDVMKSIIEHGQVIRGWLGIEVQNLTADLVESYGLKGRQGVVVSAVFRDGPAQKAGLQLGDIILSINDEVATDGRRAMNQLARARPKEKIAINVLRNNKELRLTAEVGIRPPPAPAPAHTPAANAQ